jgi:class 3 adenylate cyclase
MIAAIALLGAACAAAAPRATPAMPVHERRGVGLVVIDVKDSTPLYLAVSNRRAHATITGVLDRAQAVAAAHGGEVIRGLGDGQLLAFPTLERALEAAVQIQQSVHSWRRGQADAPIKLRASVVEGRVLFDGGSPGPEVYGRSVQRVLKLASVGDGGDVAVEASLADHPVVRRLARQSAEVKRGDALLLKPYSLQTGTHAPPLQPPLSTTRMTVAATLFATLSDWNGAYDSEGGKAGFATVKAFHEHVRRAVVELGGFVVKTQGEIVMASFSSPLTALAAATRIQRRMAELRLAAPLGPGVQAQVGLTYGRILRQDRLEGTDFYGNRVNAAARLMHLAKPGEVLVSGSLLEHRSAAALLRDVPRESLSLKGFDGRDPITALRLKPRRTKARPGGVRRLVEFVRRAMARVVPAP